MKSKLVISICAAMFFVSTAVLAEIDPGAPSASHKLETAAGDMHSYLHHHYDAGYGTHELEDAAAEIHHALHEWQHGEMSESDVVAVQEELKAAWLNYIQTITPAGVLNAGDMELEALHQGVKTAYKDLRFLLRKAK